MSDKKISESLGIPVDEEKKEETLPVVTDDENVPSTEVTPIDDDETIQDIDLARKNIQNIIVKGDDSLEEMIDLAKQSESPRAFEVAAGLMKTLLDANKDYVEMAEKKKKNREEKKESNVTNVTNNNLILSTKDMLKKLQGDETQ